MLNGYFMHFAKALPKSHGVPIGFPERLRLDAIGLQNCVCVRDRGGAFSVQPPEFRGGLVGSDLGLGLGHLKISYCAVDHPARWHLHWGIVNRRMPSACDAIDRMPSSPPKEAAKAELLASWWRWQGWPGMRDADRAHEEERRQ